MSAATTLTWPMIIMMTVSAVVAVLVVFLKPLADDWFDRKKRRIRFKLDKPTVTKTPLPQVKLKFEKFEFDRVIGYDSVIINETNRTLRNASFEICCSPGIPVDGFCWVTCDNVSLQVATQETGIAKWTIKREEIGRGEAIAVYVISTTDQLVSLKTQEDLEIYSVTAGNSTNIERISRVGEMIQKASIAAALAAAISAASGLFIH